MDPMWNALLNGGHIGEPDLAKVEMVFQKGTMPPAKYYLVHWGAASQFYGKGNGTRMDTELPGHALSQSVGC